MVKNILLIAVSVLAIASFVIVLVTVDNIRSEKCRSSRDRCIRDCERDRDRVLDDNARRRDEIITRLQRELVKCDQNSEGDRGAANRCKAEKIEAANVELGRLDTQDGNARNRYSQCEEQCRTEAQDCDERPEILGRTGDVEDEFSCPEGGAPCVQEVDEICTLISGPCTDCWRSLCGGGQWVFESGVAGEFNLFAATDPTKNPRVLATSSARGKQAVISVPPDIKLGEGERLYFGFNPKQKPDGPVKVRISRSK